MSERNGVWKITTETSVHVLDFDNMTAMRLPGNGQKAPCVCSVTEGPTWECSHHGPYPGPPVSLLRRDGEIVPLAQIPDSLVIGERALLWVKLRDDDTITMRYTTVVQLIEKVPTEENNDEEP